MAVVEVACVTSSLYTSFGSTLPPTLPPSPSRVFEASDLYEHPVLTGMVSARAHVKNQLYTDTKAYCTLLSPEAPLARFAAPTSSRG